MTKIALHFLLGLFIGMGLLFQSVQAQEIEFVNNFTLMNEELKEVSLQHYKDKTAIVVLFTSSHCSWAIRYEDRVCSLYDSFKDKNIAFLAINSNDTTMSSREKEAVMRTISPYPFPYMRDDDQVVAKLFQATKNPEVFVLTYDSSKNHFPVVYHGKIDDNPFDSAKVNKHFLKETLSALLAKQELPHESVRASGCDIR